MSIKEMESRSFWVYSFLCGSVLGEKWVFINMSMKIVDIVWIIIDIN
jgi:hypothetical protein